MMKVAIKRDLTVVNKDGRVQGHDAGDTLVRRLLRIFPNSFLIGPVPRRCDGFSILPLGAIDPTDTVIINMDVADSVGVWERVYRASGGTAPKIMNFVWRPVNQTTEHVQICTTALSCALFPTFANSERTASEVHDLVNRWTVQNVAQELQLAWVNLGFRLDHVQARREPKIPVVLYPAIYLSTRKRPALFMNVLEKVQKKIPLSVDMRLDETHLVSEKAMSIASRPWVWMGPVTATRQSYWEALAATTAFLATASEESYGLSYVEALGAGAIGVFPDLPWAHQLVPAGYPFLYPDGDEEAAALMLSDVLTHVDDSRQRLDAIAGGSFIHWIQTHHSDDVFDREIVSAVNSWFMRGE